MAHPHAGLRRLLGRKVLFQGRFRRDIKAQLIAKTEAQQATIVEKLDASTDYLVLADRTGGKAVQAKAATLNTRGANIQILDAGGFYELVEPSNEELVALMRAGPGFAGSFNKVLGIRHRISCRIHFDSPARTFTGESFDGLDLTPFDFDDLLFDQCSFVGAKLSTWFKQATRCDFSRAVGDRITFDNVESSIFREAVLGGCCVRAPIAHADFSCAFLERSRFYLDHDRQKDDTATPNVKFRSAKLKGAMFQGRQPLISPVFASADLCASRLNLTSRNANFRGANLRGATLVYGAFINADFSSADLRQANLAEADLTGANFARADLAGCNLLGAKLDGADLSRATGYDPGSVKIGTAGPALAELDALATQAKRIQLAFRMRTGDDDPGEIITIDSRRLQGGWGIHSSAFGNYWRNQSPMQFSDALLLAGRLVGHKSVRFETIEVESTKSPKSGKGLRELVILGISEALAQEVPHAAQLAAATRAYRDAVRAQRAAEMQSRTSNEAGCPATP